MKIPSILTVKPEMCNNSHGFREPHIPATSCRSTKTEKVAHWWQIGSAIAMLAAGTLLSVAGFCVPPIGEISESVLWFFGQCLLYAGSILGVGAYVNCKLHEMQHRMNC